MNGSVDPSLILPLHLLLEERNVSRAARRLGRSQPAMSHLLARLRDTFGDPLLVPRGRELILTPRAESLREPVRRLVVGLGQLLEGGGTFEPSTSSRSFRVMGTDLIQATLLPAVLEGVWHKAPHVQVLTLPYQADGVAEHLADGRVDMVFANRQAVSLPSDIRTRLLLQDRFVVVGRRGLPALAALTPQAWAALPHVLISPHGSPVGVADQELARRGLTRRVVATTSSFYAAAVLASRSEAVTTLPVLVARTLLGPLGLDAVEAPVPLPPVEFALFWHTRMDRDPAHRWLREHIAQSARAHAAAQPPAPLPAPAEPAPPPVKRHAPARSRDVARGVGRAE